MPLPKFRKFSLPFVLVRRKDWMDLLDRVEYLAADTSDARKAADDAYAIALEALDRVGDLENA